MPFYDKINQGISKKKLKTQFMGDINTTTKGLGHNTFFRWADIDSCTLF